MTASLPSLTWVPPTVNVVFLCDGPGCRKTVDPDVDGFCCSTECMVAFLKEHSEAVS